MCFKAFLFQHSLSPHARDPSPALFFPGPPRVALPAGHAHRLCCHSGVLQTRPAPRSPLGFLRGRGIAFCFHFLFLFFFFLTTRNSLSNDQSLEEKLHLDTQRHSGQRPLVITVAKSKSIPASSRNILILNEFLGTERARRRLLLFVCFPEQMGLCAFCLNINQKSIYGDVSGTG